nr:vegetative cell wall protein gp1-like [Lolium perenne]
MVDLGSFAYSGFSSITSAAPAMEHGMMPLQIDQDSYQAPLPTTTVDQSLPILASFDFPGFPSSTSVMHYRNGRRRRRPTPALGIGGPLRPVTRELVWLDQLPTLSAPATLLPRAATLLPRAATLLPRAATLLPRARTSPSPAAPHLSRRRPPRSWPSAARARTSPSPAAPHLPVAGRPAAGRRPPALPPPFPGRPPPLPPPFPGRPPPLPLPFPGRPARPPAPQHTAPRRPLPPPPAARRSGPLLPQHTAPAPSFRSRAARASPPLTGRLHGELKGTGVSTPT